MKDVGADRRKAAVQSMFRVRASESPPGPDGMRTVWHQGGEGADLTSTVDAQGRVVRQEFALFGEYLLWVAETGAATGRVRDEKAAGQVKGSDLVARDAALDEQVLSRMNAALAGYSGSDRYLQHLARVVANVLVGLRDFDAVPVTSAANKAFDPQAATPAAAPSAPASRLTMVLGLAVAAIAVAIAIILLAR